MHYNIARYCFYLALTPPLGQRPNLPPKIGRLPDEPLIAGLTIPAAFLLEEPLWKRVGLGKARRARRQDFALGLTENGQNGFGRVGRHKTPIADAPTSFDRLASRAKKEGAAPG